MSVSILKMVTITLGSVLVILALGSVVLAVLERPIPGMFETIMFAGFTGLLGMLAPSKSAMVDKVVATDRGGDHRAP